jgi:hypothetical protein
LFKLLKKIYYTVLSNNNILPSKLPELALPCKTFKATISPADNINPSLEPLKKSKAPLKSDPKLVLLDD